MNGISFAAGFIWKARPSCSPAFRNRPAQRLELQLHLDGLTLTAKSVPGKIFHGRNGARTGAAHGMAAINPERLGRLIGSLAESCFDRKRLKSIGAAVSFLS